MKHKLKSFFSIGLIVAAGAFVTLPLTSCTEATVNLPAHVRSISIPTFSNTSKRPGLEFDVTERVIQQFMASSALAVTPRVDEADALIEGEIYRYTLTPISWDQTNRIIQYKMQILTRISLRDRRTGEVFWSDEVDGITMFSLVASPPQTEESAIFEAADELARDIFFLVHDGRQFTDDDLLFDERTRGGEVQPGEVRRDR